MHKGKKHTLKKGSRKHKGGYYSMSGAIAPGAANWTRHSEMGDWAVSNRGGNTQYGSGKRRKGGNMGFCPPDMSAPGPDGKCADGSDPMTQAPMGGRKRRSMKNMKLKKGKHGRKTMKGGNKFGGVFPSYTGTGSRGIIDVKGVDLRGTPGTAAGGAFNNFGAQPGSGYGSFIKAH